MCVFWKQSGIGFQRELGFWLVRRMEIEENLANLWMRLPNKLRQILEMAPSIHPTSKDPSMLIYNVVKFMKNFWFMIISLSFSSSFSSNL